MKFYHKKLSNLTDLDVEKQLLKSDLANGDIKKLFSSKTHTVANPTYPSPGGILSASFLVEMALKYLPLLTRKQTKKDSGKSDKEQEKSVNPLLKIVFEVGGAYLKWKALELSYREIKKLVKNKKKDAPLTV